MTLAAEWESAKPLVSQDEWDKAKPVEATALDRGKAALGGANRGVAGILGLPVDTAENLINLGISGVGSIAAAAGRPDLAPSPLKGSFGGSEAIAGIMERLGIGTKNPRPDDPASRMLNTAGMIAGGSILPGASVKSTLAAATGGALAGEALGPEYIGVGAMTPAAVAQGAAGVKNAIAAKAAPVVETFKQAGAMPSVGQATDSTFLHGLENLAAKFPGGAGVMKNFIENQQKNIGSRARTGVPSEAAGRAIEEGIKSSGGFIERTKQQWQQLDNAVAAKIPQGAAFTPSNTVQALDDLTRPVRGAERTTGALVNPKIAEMKDNLVADLQANSGVVPFDALRALRSKVGSMMDEALVTGIPGGEIKKVYSALSKDLESAATQAGAGREFARQNNFYRARMDRIETVLDRVIGKNKQPEEIFKAVMPTDPDQANKLRAVMRSLSQPERQIVAEAAANRLGRATPGNQNVVGDVFSSETFLTNWNRLSPGAKAQLFPDPPLRENIQKIAEAAGHIRSGKGIYANPSGSAGSFAAYAVYMGPIAAIGGGLGGVPGALASSAASAATANIGAKMLTNPKIVEWLATPVNPKTPQAAQHLARLGVIYNSIKDEGLKAELDQFMESIQK